LAHLGFAASISPVTEAAKYWGGAESVKMEI
jgi:hypothetical protein